MTIVTLVMVVMAVAVNGVVGVGQAWAWSDVGHNIICEIAFHELNDHARTEVSKLLAKDDEFKLFSESCIWPSSKTARVEHFVNVPRNVTKIDSNACPGPERCLLSA